MPALPSGTVTFLFTDIEGSTRLWQEQATAMRPALARHDAIVREAIEQHDGHLVKTTGDGAHAAFATASDAVDAAIAAQFAISAEPWPLPDPLRVRMGIHSGPAELRDGDYYGTAVNRAARIMSVAHGGQVVVSLAAEELAREGAVEMLDLGEHRLQDLGQPDRIFQILHPDLERDFPPLRSLDAVTTNLPTLRTSFVGREAELAAIGEALADARLVTLTGVGGVGKTRLAVHAAADAVADFPDGVWLVELAVVGDPDAVPDAVASTVGIVPKAGLTMTASIAEAMAGRRALLVLDNCEHVLDAAADLVEAILTRPGPAKVLATSREGLRLADERLWPVPTLGGRDAGDDAIALFVDRARAVAPDFSLEAPETAAAVSEICRRLDGIPLAIELAAARTIAMSAPELRDRLDDRFRLLSGSRRGLERHQTLRQAVQWSYDLLDDDERVLLGRCSVFAGGFDLGAGVEVGGHGELDEYEVFDRLEALVRKSLVFADRASGRTRYSMLETIRQFAEEQLATVPDELADTRARHARFYAGTASEMASGLGGARDREALVWFWDEFANLRAGFRTAVDTGDLDAAAVIAVDASIGAYFSDSFEPASWAEELLDEATARDHHLLAALYAVASMVQAEGRLDDATRYADACRALYEDPRYQAIPSGLAAAFVGVAYQHSGRPEAWVEFCRVASDRSPGVADWSRSNLAIALIFSGLADDARGLAGGVLRDAEASGSLLMLMGGLVAYGLAFFDDPDAALRTFRRFDEVSRELGVQPGNTGALLARAEAAYGSTEAALDACASSLAGFAASGDRSAAGTPLSVLAALLHRLGRDEDAAILTGSGAGPAVAAYPELRAAIDDLRANLGSDTFDALAARGQALETNAMFRYALEQVDGARTLLR